MGRLLLRIGEEAFARPVQFQPKRDGGKLVRIFQPAICHDFLSVDHRSEALRFAEGRPSKERSRTNPIPRSALYM